MNYYNEWDSFAAKWLKELIKDGLIPDGEVDSRSIADVEPSDLKGFTQCHFFAGIGGWSRALQLAGWSADRPVWTGSPPCQPFSTAGKQSGKEDLRHLWPVFFNLIRECQPSTIFGEQVQAQLDLDGLTIYKGTWKQKVTPQQRSYYQVVVSQPRTKGTDSSSWLTPTTSDMNGVREMDGKRSGGLNTQAQSAWPTPRVADTNNLNNSPTVVKDRVTKGRATVAEIASHNINAWPTPTTQNAKENGYPGEMTRKTIPLGAMKNIINAWPTPMAADWKDRGKWDDPSVQRRVKIKKSIELSMMVGSAAEYRHAKKSPWATPTTQEAKHSTPTEWEMTTDHVPTANSLRVQANKISGQNQKSSTAGTENIAPSQLNPRFSLWLMGYPIEWAYCAERVTQSSRKRQQKS